MDILQKMTRWSLIIAGCLATIITLVFIIVLNSKAEAPAVTGQTLNVATEAIEKSGLKIDYVKEFSNIIAKGIVISQDTEGGEKLNKGNIVTLHVSDGIEQVVVPKLENDTQELAEKKLKELSFCVTVTYAFSDTIEKGLVVSQSVQADNKADKGSNINIVISNGPDDIVEVPSMTGKTSEEATDDLLEVPRLTGKTLEEARDTLSLAGYNIKTDIKCSDTVREGFIISQDAQPGSKLKRDSDISVIVSAGVANTVGNTNANSRNRGIAAAQGNWIYYSNMRYNYYLYKMRLDGTEKQILTKDNVCSVNVVGEWVYYTNESDASSLYKIRIDGSKRTKINSDVSYSLHVVNEWVYYVSKDTIYKIKTDGSEKTFLCSDVCMNINVEGNWIYYINNNNSRMYKISTDGTSRSEIREGIQAAYLNVADGMLYYSWMSTIGKIKPDGTGLLSYNFPNRQMDFINVSNGWIYFLEHDFSGGPDNVKTTLSKMRIDGTEKQEIIQIKFSEVNFYINVLNDWIYFPNKDDNNYLYRVMTDGSNLQKMY